ncbi:hypothetical protein [Desertivirga arenae]|uniref:hypothetical protein n=1 Tax=Desertivirga arenae TaxID=2810309 RepID=UPI001A95AC47|nr:hypothetical protein [Pedobacter sp. SYSU D00823]
MKKIFKAPLFLYLLVLLQFNLTHCTKGSQDYLVVHKDEGPHGTVLKLVLQNVIGKDSLIEIARQIRQETEKKENFVVYYYLPGMNDAICWTAVTYAKDSTDCNAKDRSNVCVEYEEVIPGIKTRNELRALKSKEYNKSQILKEVPDMFAKVKYEIYRPDPRTGEGRFIVVRPDGTTRSLMYKYKEDGMWKRNTFISPANAEGAFELDEAGMWDYQCLQCPNGRYIPF